MTAVSPNRPFTILQFRAKRSKTEGDEQSSPCWRANNGDRSHPQSSLSVSILGWKKKSFNYSKDWKLKWYWVDPPSDSWFSNLHMYSPDQVRSLVNFNIGYHREVLTAILHCFPEKIWSVLHLFLSADGTYWLTQFLKYVSQRVGIGIIRNVIDSIYGQKLKSNLWLRPLWLIG